MKKSILKIFPEFNLKRDKNMNKKSINYRNYTLIKLCLEYINKKLLEKKLTIYLKIRSFLVRNND